MRKVFTIFFVCIVLAACSDEGARYDYIYTGEGEQWDAEFSVSGTEVWEEDDGTVSYSNEYDNEFVLTYKGTSEELSSLESLEFSFDTSVGSTSTAREFDEPPEEVTFRSSGGGSGPKIKEDEVIQVNVKWDGLEESFELQNDGGDL